MVATVVRGRSKVLRVPYHAQPTGNTCQSTCLRMMAAYLEQSIVFQSTGAGTRDIEAIRHDINDSPNRPIKAKNAHGNVKWWLEKHFPTVHFDYETITNEAAALERIVRFIDGDMPVIVSVSHARVEGHIILVVGYENFVPSISTPQMKLVVHDPYGRFDPLLVSKLYGKHRYDVGMSLPDGNEIGPGQACRLPITAVNRHRHGDARSGTFYLLSGHR